MNNGRLDRALLLAVVTILYGLYWQMFSVNGDIIDLNARVSGVTSEVSERLARVETLEYIVPSLADQSP